MEVTVAAVGPTPQGNVVLLLDLARRRAVPVFIGESEAFSIRLRLQGKSYSRPLTHDLLESVLRELGGKLELVRIERLQNSAYVATIVVLRDRRRIELDSRSSDAIALALGSRVPIYMSEKLLRDSGVDLERLPPPPEEQEQSAPSVDQKGIEM